VDHSERGTFLPALRFHALTRFYDPITAATLRQRTLTRRLAELAAPRAGAKVLDVGCGTATVALELARREPRASISGIDADDAMLDRARAKAADAGVELDLRTAMAQELPFPDDSFDEVRDRDALRTPYGLMVFVTGSA
jgi:ubiquinone/menaquinone biosynthesis C-methylase UbiE